MLTELDSLTSSIKEKANKVEFFQNRCKNVARILVDNMNKFFNNQQSKKAADSQLSRIKENMQTISERFDHILEEKSMWLYIYDKNNSMEQIITDVNDSMRRINIILEENGVKDLKKLPRGNLFDDYVQISEYLDKSIFFLQERRSQVNDILKQNHEDYSDKSVDAKEVDEDILNRDEYAKYKLKKSDFKKTKKCNYSNSSFDYYNGYRISDDKKVTILKLKNNKIFERLLSVLVKIDHPNVESFIGAYIKNKKVTIITNRSGISLENYLSFHKADDPYSLKPGDKTILAFKIAEAMSYLHSRSVIHRNLNTSNVFIAQSNDDYINPIIVGFKNSRLMPNNPTMGVSNANMNISDYLSAYFYAPEFNDSHTYNEKMDVFSFSAILYELLTGHKPFISVPLDKITQFLNDGIRPDLPEDTPQDLQNLFKFCWHKDPKERYSFDKIIEVMSEKKIIFPFDEKNRDFVLNFYDKNAIKSNTANNCVKTFEMIKKDIGKAFQYRFELIRAQSNLQNYQISLRHSEYSTKETLEDEEKKKMESLLTNLNQLKNVVSELSFDNFDEKIGNLMKGRINFKPSQVTEDLTNLMINIHDSMKDLGFDDDDIKPYQENINDLVFDYRELENYLNQKLSGRTYFLIKKEINDFYKLKNLNDDVPKKALKERLKDLFSPFRNYAVNPNDYEIIDKGIASNVSVVYKGKNIKTGQEVAIKVISENYLKKGERNLILLRREIGYLTRLKHEYIADFVGFCLPEKNNNVWLISDYISGGTLKEKIESDMEFNGTKKTKVAFQIAELLDYLHSKRVLHLDIKSTNILMKGETPKVIDFGFACSDNDVQKIDIKNFGTPNYRAPEVLKGNYDYKADVFSYAMLLWEMYDNAFPFSEIEQDPVVISGLIEKGVDFSFSGDANDRLVELIKIGYHKDPGKRPSFNQILNTMINDTIMFPESEIELIKEFYNSKRESINQLNYRPNYHSNLTRSKTAPY